MLTLTTHASRALPVFALLSCISAQAAIPASEVQALTNLYNATNGASWTNSTNWLTVGAECTWYGVTCDGNETHVAGLALPSNQLTGALSDLSALTALQTLDLSNNLLTGSFPSLSSSGLHPFSIRVNDNQLSGPLAANLNSLAFGSLYAQNNMLTGALPSFPFGGMYHLDLHNNQFTGSIPNWNGTIWVDIDLSSNQLEGSVPSLASLQSLQAFHIAHNQLSGAPPELPTNSVVGVYDISYNAFTGSLPVLPNANSSVLPLVAFTVDHNELSGPVPDIQDTVLWDYKESLLCPNHLDPHTTTQIGFDWAAATNQPWIPLEGKRASWYQGCDDWIFVQGFQ